LKLRDHDVIVVLISNGHHWMMGMILMKTNTIIVTDSLFSPNKAEYRIYEQRLKEIVEVKTGEKFLFFALEVRKTLNLKQIFQTQ
jgi:Ulp1 family protease